MFDGLSKRLSGILDGLRGRGALSESDVNDAMREVRRALLEADVRPAGGTRFHREGQGEAVGANVIKSVTPGQMVVKIVNDALVETLCSDADPISLDSVPPVAILMVGLQGSARRQPPRRSPAASPTGRRKRAARLARYAPPPAAMEQLRILAGQVKVDFPAHRCRAERRADRQSGQWKPRALAVLMW